MAVEDKDREDLEAQLMGGEVQGDEPGEPDGSISAPTVDSGGQPDTKDVKEPDPEVTREHLQERLAKAEKERHDFERAMREEREAKKQSERTLQSLLDRLESAQAETKKEEPVDRAPVYEEDPAAYLKWQNDQILEDRRREVAQREEEKKARSQSEEYQKWFTAIKQGINQYAESTPDYNDAAKFLVESRIKELDIMGVRDKQEVMQTLKQEEFQVGAWALQRGISPGELIYNLAKTRGYAGKIQSGDTGGGNDRPRVKSLSNISGSPSGNKESLQARAERILAATNLKDVLALNPDDMEKILKEAR